MPLPSGGLTGHFDASDDDHVWKTWTAGAPYHSGTPVDGDEVEVWQGEAGLVTAVTVAAGTKPRWRQSVPLMLLPCLDFDGADDLLPIYDTTGAVLKALSDLISAGSYTLFVSFWLEGVATSSAAAYNNEALIADTGGYFGVHLRDLGGSYAVQAYNWDGSEDKVELPATLGASHVLAVRHEAGTLYASLDGGPESSVASGDTQVITGNVSLGRASSGQYADCRIGELAIYNVALSAPDRASAAAYFAAKWLAPGQVAGAQSSESDTANAGGVRVSLGGSQGAETDTANAGALRATVSGARATETDSPLVGSVVAASPGSGALEIDAALAGSPLAVVHGTQAGVADLALGGSVVASVAGSSAIEVDTATGGAMRVLVTGTQATEADTALAGTASGGSTAVFGRVEAGDRMGRQVGVGDADGALVAAGDRPGPMVAAGDSVA